MAKMGCFVNGGDDDDIFSGHESPSKCLYFVLVA
jgi:hypothetical protein